MAPLRQQLGVSEAEMDELLSQVALEAIKRQPMTWITETLLSLAPLFTVEERNMPLLWLSNRAWADHPTLSQLVQQPGAVQDSGRQAVERVLGIYRPERFGLVPPILGLLGLSVALGRRRRDPLIVPALMAAWLVVVQAALW